MTSTATKVETLEVSKSKGRNKDGKEEEIGCWVRFTFRGCMPSRSKVDSTMSGTTNTSCGNFLSHAFSFLFNKMFDNIHNNFFFFVLLKLMFEYLVKRLKWDKGRTIKFKRNIMGIFAFITVMFSLITKKNVFFNHFIYEKLFLSPFTCEKYNKINYFICPYLFYFS